MGGEAQPETGLLANIPAFQRYRARWSITVSQLGCTFTTIDRCSRILAVKDINKVQAEKLPLKVPCAFRDCASCKSRSNLILEIADVIQCVAEFLRSSLSLSSDTFRRWGGWVSTQGDVQG